MHVLCNICVSCIHVHRHQIVSYFSIVYIHIYVHVYSLCIYVCIYTCMVSLTHTLNTCWFLSSFMTWCQTQFKNSYFCWDIGYFIIWQTCSIILSYWANSLWFVFLLNFISTNFYPNVNKYLQILQIFTFILMNLVGFLAVETTTSFCR